MLACNGFLFWRSGWVCRAVHEVQAIDDGEQIHEGIHFPGKEGYLNKKDGIRLDDPFSITTTLEYYLRTIELPCLQIKITTQKINIIWNDS